MRRLFTILFVLLACPALSAAVAAQDLHTQSVAPADSAKQSAEEDKVYSSDEVDQKAKFKNLKKIISGLSSEECGDKGFIRLKVVLRKSGEVTDITVEARMGCSSHVEEKAIEAVRKLQFTPAMKGGVPVSQSASVEFQLHVY